METALTRQAKRREDGKENCVLAGFLLFSCVARFFKVDDEKRLFLSKSNTMAGGASFPFAYMRICSSVFTFYSLVFVSTRARSSHFSLQLGSFLGWRSANKFACNSALKYSTVRQVSAEAFFAAERYRR
jgi:hypothetical protein